MREKTASFQELLDSLPKIDVMAAPARPYLRMAEPVLDAADTLYQPLRQAYMVAPKGEDEEELTQVKSAGTVGLSGRDNRTPFVGRTQFPTEGSKQRAKQISKASKDVAEVGPAPLTRQLDKTKTLPLKNVMVTMPTAKGSLPIVKQANLVQNDPLVVYMRKHAAQLDTNLDKVLTQILEPSMQDRDSDFEGTPADKKNKESDELLSKLFSNYSSEKPTI